MIILKILYFIQNSDHKVLKSFRRSRLSSYRSSRPIPEKFFRVRSLLILLLQFLNFLRVHGLKVFNRRLHLIYLFRSILLTRHRGKYLLLLLLLLLLLRLSKIKLLILINRLLNLTLQSHILKLIQ